MQETICIFHAAEEAPIRETSITKSLSESPKTPKHLDRDNSRAYYFGGKKDR